MKKLFKAKEEYYVGGVSQYLYGAFIPEVIFKPSSTPNPTPSFTPTLTPTITPSTTPAVTPTMTPSPTPPIPVSDMIYRFDASLVSNFALRSSGGVDFVEVWRDTSGKNNHVSQSDTSKQPIYESDGYGSYQVKFDGVDDFLSVTGITNIVSGITAYTEFMVFEVDVYASEFRIDSSDGEVDSIYQNSNDRFMPLFYPGAAFTPLSSWALQPEFLLWSRKGITSGSMVGQLNDQDQTSVLFDSWTPDTITKLLLGVNSSASGSFFPGKLREVIVYSTLLSDSQTAQVYSYLKTKWNYSSW